MSEADPAAVKQYLLGRQMQPEVIDWKYFDATFNRDRERGVVWVRQNQVAGFLGLIPFPLEKNDDRADCAWSCDWSVDPQQGSGMGLMLVKRARELYDGIFNLGGNQNTRQIFPRLADRTVPDAGVGLVLPLRLGSIFARLPAGMIRSLLSRQEFLQQIPLRWVRVPSSVVTIRPALSPHIMPLFDDAPRGDWRPRYDSEFVRWQFGRCPALACCSCWISLESPLRTAALIWRSQSSKRFWRFAFCGDTTDPQKITTLIKAITSFVYRQGCVALFAIASHREKDLINLLARCGFLRHNRLPFYVVRGRHDKLPTDEFCVLNFLDADLAYRFEQDSVATDR